MTTDSLIIRPAVAADGPHILAFITELAAYEKMSDEVRTSQADIERQFFGSDPKVFCEIAEADGAPVGFAVWFYTYSTFAGSHGIYLEDLYVRGTARGTGAGFALMRRLARRCVAERLARLEWAVLDWNRLALDFYEQIGAAEPKGWLSRRLDGAALARLGAR